MRTNKKRYYISVESKVYSLTQRQFDEVKELYGIALDLARGIGIADKESIQSEDAFYTALDYIQENGRFECELDYSFRY